MITVNKAFIDGCFPKRIEGKNAQRHKETTKAFFKRELDAGIIPVECENKVNKIIQELS